MLTRIFRALGLSRPKASASHNIASEKKTLDDGVPNFDVLQIEKKYQEERAKRLRDEGDKQFVDISLSDKFKHFQQDVWADTSSIKDLKAMFPDARCRVLILGAGLGGLLYAVRMIEAGIQPEDIRIVDIAGGFGGTWYWNRYPGINCDIESYCYLPLLEETGFVPKHRYSHGQEIRQYAELIARRWDVADKGVFQTKAEMLQWEDAAKEWRVTLSQSRLGNSAQRLEVRSQIVVTVNGVLNWPKLPDLPGIHDYQGKTFHSSRWDYSFTGGSQTDPTLSNLKGKRVALVGTGASGIQVAPHLARWAEHLYVVQRTPAAVEQRHQCETDVERFGQTVANSPGWQRERLRNFHQHFTTGRQPKSNLVDDSWTQAVGMVAISGNPAGPESMDELPHYVQKLHNLDLPRQNRIRQRIEEVVKDKKVAKQLKPWYPTWCKRPCFSDEYLETFNHTNVTLLDASLDGLTSDSIVIGGKELAVDAVIFATGFRAPFGGSPAEKANLKIIGRDGVSMSDAWARNGPSTLHGLMDQGFPNLFLSGPWQAALSPNNLCGTDTLAKQASYILVESEKQAAGKPFSIAPTAAAVQDWGMQVMMRSPPMAAAAGCTPSYFNMEGDMDRAPPEAQLLMARSGLWGRGIEDFISYMDAWRENGDMQGIEVQI